MTARLKEMPGKDIWICGGSSIIQPLIRENLIDEYRVSVIPTILGDGILLFGKRETELQLRLKETKMYNGIGSLFTPEGDEWHAGLEFHVSCCIIEEDNT